MKYRRAVAAHSPRHPTLERRGGQRFTGLLPSHLEIESTAKTTQSGGHFSGFRLKSDTSPTLCRDLLPHNPTAKRLPSRLIPPCSPFVLERRGGSSCGNRYNVANQQRERRGNPGRGAPGGSNCHSPRRRGRRHGTGVRALNGP